MANAVILLGKSGTGKSSSIKGLNPKETVVLNVLGKKLPFKGSSQLYNQESKNLFRVDDYTQVINMLQGIDKNASYIHNIIILSSKSNMPFIHGSLQLTWHPANNAVWCV